MENLHKRNVIEEYVFNDIEAEQLLLRLGDLNENDYELSKVVLKLLKGEKDVVFSNLFNLIEGKSKNVILLRWKAIEAIYNDDYILAESILLEAIKLARKSRVDKWIVRDIQLDLYNLEFRKEGNRSFYSSNKYQKKLESMDIWNYRPYIDWNLENSLNDSIIENFNYQTDSPSTIRFGGTFRNSTQKFLNAFEAVILNGSYTFIHILRGRLAYIFYNYGSLLNESNLLLHSLRLFMIEGKIKNVEKILSSNWDDLYPVLIDNPSTLLEFSFLNNDKTESKVLKCIIIKKFGAYFTENEVNNFNEFLKHCLNQNFSMNSILDVQRNAVKAYEDIINRIKDKEEIIEILVELYTQNNDLISDEIIRIFSKVEWELIPEKIAIFVADAIYYNIKKTNLETNVYYTLAKIKNCHPNILENIEKDMIKNWKVNEDLSINNYFSQFHLESELKKDMIKNLIYKIEKNNLVMRKGAPISVGGYRLFLILSNHLALSEDFEEYNLIDLYKSILLNPYQTTDEKINCLSSIINLIGHNNFFEKYIKMNMKEFFGDKNNYEKILDSRSDSFMTEGNKKVLEMKLLELCVDIKVFQKGNIVNEMIAKCIEFGFDESLEVRQSTLHLIESISKAYDEIYQNEILQFLYSKTFEKWFKIRGQSIFLLNIIGSKNLGWKNIIINRTSALSYDSSLYVRSSIIQSYLKLDKSISKDLEIEMVITNLKRDKHYKLRARALKLDKNIN
ncbi:hypothetical protein [Exiguobacterium undae]|uniref:hypothetical protein n=1 Tax=Exiguobacterium undae TaxID=169177 RepID=UPI00047A409D|nr:hypothetical protein [Exiguobacterium undae]